MQKSVSIGNSRMKQTLATKASEKPPELQGRQARLISSGFASPNSNVFSMSLVFPTLSSCEQASTDKRASMGEKRDSNGNDRL
jgi:hypothetical protein